MEIFVLLYLVIFVLIFVLLERAILKWRLLISLLWGVIFVGCFTLGIILVLGILLEPIFGMVYEKPYQYQ
jgi:hypothetical protein